MDLKRLKNFINFFRPKSIEFKEGFSSWNEALDNHSKGYSDEKILNNIKESVMKVLSGKAKYERDGFLFYDHKFIDLLLIPFIEFQKEENIKVLDIGGSFASIYLQHKLLLDEFKNLSWVILEQKNFVEEAQNIFEDKKLIFEDSLDNIENLNTFDIVLFSSSIQYFQNFENVLKTILNSKPKFILILRTPFHEGEEHKIMIQKSNIGFKSSYPARVFSRNKFLKYFIDNYEIKIQNLSDIEDIFFTNHQTEISFRNYLFSKHDER